MSATSDAAPADPDTPETDSQDAFLNKLIEKLLHIIFSSDFEDDSMYPVHPSKYFLVETTYPAARITKFHTVMSSLPVPQDMTSLIPEAHHLQIAVLTRSYPYNTPDGRNPVEFDIHIRISAEDQHGKEIPLETPAREEPRVAVATIKISWSPDRKSTRMKDKYCWKGVLQLVEEGLWGDQKFEKYIPSPSAKFKPTFANMEVKVQVYFKHDT